MEQSSSSDTHDTADDDNSDTVSMQSSNSGRYSLSEFAFEMELPGVESGMWVPDRHELEEDHDTEGTCSCSVGRPNSQDRTCPDRDPHLGGPVDEASSPLALGLHIRTRAKGRSKSLSVTRWASAKLSEKASEMESWHIGSTPPL